MASRAQTERQLHEILARLRHIGVALVNGFAPVIFVELPDPSLVESYD